ncbi:MAG TPA: hypothetical protein VNB90_00975 [Cytophagaceae bacterium]|nr:hypothetical protein [Cytophagaceae bacterium]
MKQSIFVVGLAIVATTIFSSCKKDYTCKCQKIYTDSSGSVSVNDGSYVFKDNEARASDQCNKQESTGTDLRGQYSRQCDIQ